MIHRLFSSDGRFKTLLFRKGLNILLADKEEASTATDTRNGAGKTSVVDLIHFLLGADWERSRDDAIREDSFGLEIDLAGQRLVVQRSGAKPTRVYFGGADTSRWPIQPEQRADGLSMRVDDWNAVLGHFAFRLPIEHHDEPFRPKFRNLFSYFARRVKDGGFLDPHTNHRHQKVWDQQVCVTYLLGLDWSIPRDMERIRSKERSRRELMKLLAEEDGGNLRELLPSSAELRTKLHLDENRAGALRQSLADFRVVEEYHDLEREVDGLTAELSSLSDQNTIDRQLLSELEHALAVEAPADSAGLAQIYEEAGLLLPVTALNRFDDVKAFHESVIRNRRSYLLAEVASVQARLAATTTSQRAVDSRRSQVLKILQTSGALESFIQLQDELARVQATVEHLRKQHERALELENSGREVSIERAQLESRMAINQREQSTQIGRAVVIFADISKRLYTRAGRLTVNNTLTGAPVRIEIPRIDSEGVSNMQVFCFDMTMLHLMAERKMGPSFLIHDSHLFDGVDARQISRALQIATEVSESLGRQYIATMNTDVAEAVTKEGFPVSEAALPVRLSDQEGGGLFGRPFGGTAPRRAAKRTRS